MLSRHGRSIMKIAAAITIGLFTVIGFLHGNDVVANYFSSREQRDDAFRNIIPGAYHENPHVSYEDVTSTPSKNNDGNFSAENCETLPAAVDTILWGAGEGDQVHDIVGAFFIAKRLGIPLIEQNLRKSFTKDPTAAIPLNQLLNYSHPVVFGQLHTLDCVACPSSLWEADIRNTCFCRSRYMKGGVASIFQKCNRTFAQFSSGDGFNLTHYHNTIQKDQSLFLRAFDPCGLQRGAVHCPWVKEDLRAVGPGFFVSNYPGLRPFDGSNYTCAHLRINDEYMAQVRDGVDISEMKAIEVLDADNFGCCYHTMKGKKPCAWDGHLKDLTFVDYVRTILFKNTKTLAQNAYFMAPPGVAKLVRPLASEYDVTVNFLEDFIDEQTFQGSFTHADKILCASTRIFAGTKSSFSSTVKMMRGYQQWVWLHQYYNMSAVSVDTDKEFYRVEDWELPEE